MAKAAKKRVTSPRIREFQEHLNQTSKSNVIVGYDYKFDDIDEALAQNEYIENIDRFEKSIMKRTTTKQK